MADGQCLPAVEQAQERLTNSPTPLHTLDEWHTALEQAGSFSSLTQHAPTLAALMKQRCQRGRHTLSHRARSIGALSAADASLLLRVW